VLKKISIYGIYIVVMVLMYLAGALTVEKNLFPLPQIMQVRNLLTPKIVDKKPLYLKNKIFMRDVNLHTIYIPQEGTIIMLGDSLTKRVDWNELFNVPILNRGMDSDITEGYIHRLDHIISLHPKKVFLNGGTNDIHRGLTADTIFTNYKIIFQSLKENKIPIYMQSILYTRFPPYNLEIKKLNNLLKEYCNQNMIIYIDLNEKLSVNEAIKEEYTLDGSHLNAEGYKIWKNILNNYIL